MRTYHRPILSEPSLRLLSEFALRHGIVCTMLLTVEILTCLFFGSHVTTHLVVVVVVVLGVTLFKKAFSNFNSFQIRSGRKLVGLFFK